MKEIEVGDFVRLDDGTIGKYNINKNWINVVETNNQYSGFDIEKDIVKHSKNIIDLLEVGDYVNGEYICNITNCLNENGINEKSVVINEMGYNEYAENLFNKDIKSIVTHEQFASMKYKVGE